MNLSYLSKINNCNNYYKYRIKQNDAPCPQQVSESIFIYTCEPVEAVSFKGAAGLNKSVIKTVLPAAVALCGVISSFFRKPKFNVESDYEADIKKIIQNQKDMEYICALKCNFVPYNAFEEEILSNYNKNFEMLEQENKVLISKNVDRILAMPKYMDLPADYPERIKSCVVSQSTFDGDKFEITEKTIDSHISELKKSDEKEMKKNAEINKSQELTPHELDSILTWQDAKQFSDYTVLLKNLGITDNRIAKLPVKELLKEIKENKENQTEEEKIINNLAERFSSGKISVEQLCDEIIQLVKTIPEPICGSGDNNHEGIISPIL